MYGCLEAGTNRVAVLSALRNGISGGCCWESWEETGSRILIVALAVVVVVVIMV